MIHGGRGRIRERLVANSRLWSDRRDRGELFKSRIRTTLGLPSGYAECVQGSKGLDFAMLRVEIIFERNPCSRHAPLLLDLIKDTV
jgi:hypothetical protein